MKGLHSKQSTLLKLLQENKDNPLTVKDLRVKAGIGSPGVLYHHLEQLEKKGYLKTNPNNSKDYIVLDTPENSVVYIPKYGMAQCGPEGIILDDNIEEQIPIASSLLRFPAAEAFIVEARGNSMEPKIKEGDIIIAKKQNYAENGEVIVCSHKSIAMIKVFSKHENIVALNSLNFNTLPISVYNDEDLVVAGVVKNILKYNTEF